jgi:hypothetical protein
MEHSLATLPFKASPQINPPCINMQIFWANLVYPSFILLSDGMDNATSTANPELMPLSPQGYKMNYKYWDDERTVVFRVSCSLNYTFFRLCIFPTTG